MKRIILLATILCCSITQAQVSIKGNGTEITEGQVFNSNVLSGPGSKIILVVTNNSDADVHLKLRADAVSHPTNENVQFCFGEMCYYDVSAGNKVPNGLTGLTLGPGETNPSGDHFESQNAGNGVDPVSYSFSLIQLDESGATIAVLRTFSYVYTPTAAIDDFTSLQNIGINLGSTVVKNQLDVTTTNAATLELYNLNGQLVKTVTLAQGAQSVDISSLSTAVYVASFTTENNKKSKIRIVKN